MKPATIIASLMLCCAVPAAMALSGTLFNARIDDLSSFDDPVAGQTHLDGQGGWIAFSVPAVEGTRSTCCWNGPWSRKPGRNATFGAQTGCRLGERHQGYGNLDDSPETQRLTVFARIDGGVVSDVTAIGDTCRMDAGGQSVAWLGSVEDSHAIDWLVSVIGSQEPPRFAREGALFALAHHRSTDVSEHLLRLAKTGRSHAGETAVFWLGQARGADGYLALKQLLDELPNGDRRRQINFALSQNSTAAAADLLFQISAEDRDRRQRADALFWLAQSGHPRALEQLHDVASHGTSRDLRERALHGLAELDSQGGADALAGIAIEHPDRHTRGQAMLWMAQAYPDRAEPMIRERIFVAADRNLIHQLVFAASQLPNDQGSQLLLEFAQGNYPREIRRQAIFWLAQSDDDDAVEALARMIER